MSTHTCNCPNPVDFSTTMKLRIRSLETNETLKINITSPDSTLEQLKNLIFQSLPSSSSNSVHVSLNRKDELQPSDQTLQSFGITSGDLIFYTFNPLGFSISPKPLQDPNFLNNLDTQLVQEPEKVKTLDTQVVQESETVKKMEPHDVKTRTLMPQGEEIEELMEVDDGGYSDMMVDVNFGKSFSVPGFLRKVFTEELSDDHTGGRDHKLLVVALHAVFVESGFVLIDPVSFTESEFWKCCPSGRKMSLFYTLPEVIDNVKCGNFNVNHTVELKFQFLGKFFIAHGSLLGGGGSIRRVSLNEDQLVPYLNVTWANCGLHEEITGKDGVFETSTPESEVFQFWRNVKDGLVLPLLIDLCDKAGLGLPPCFTRLPTDLKLKVLELLPGVDIAKVSCVSSELRYLGSSDDLWRKKFVEQFGDAETSGAGGHWKEKFVMSWESRKRRRLSLSLRRSRGDPRRLLGGRPLPFIPLVPWRPHIIGGDHDLFPPPFDNTSNPFGQVPPSMLLRRVSNHVPRCNLGGDGINFP